MKDLLAPIALCAAVMIAIVGCGGSTSTQPSSSSAPAASASSPSSPSEPAPTSSPAVLPSLPAIFSNHADPALEGQLPTEVSGIALQRYSLALAAVLDAGGDRAAIDAFLQRIGKTESDSSVAGALDPTNRLTGGILAYKVSGAETATLLAGIVSVEQSDLGAGAAQRQGTVGGKSVTIVSVGAGVNDTEWIYGRGDVVFVVHADSETHAAAYLSALS